MHPCLNKAKPGDEVWVKRIFPIRYDIKDSFPTTLLGFNAAGTLLLGCNAPGGLNGGPPDTQDFDFCLEQKVKKFKWFAYLSAALREASLKIIKIVKK